MISIPRGTWKDYDDGRPGPYWIGPVRRFLPPTADEIDAVGKVAAWDPARRQPEPDTANVVCGKGHAGLINGHTIATDGTVSPSVVCTEAGCDWHETIRLDGWVERQDPR